VKEVESEYLEIDSLSVEKISPGEIVLGDFVNIDEAGRPLVIFPGQEEALVAVSTLEITPDMIGRQVALLFANGKLDTPVIMGLIHSPLNSIINNYDVSGKIENDVDTDIQDNADTKQDEILIDGKRVVLEGKEEIVLKCGESSITLTKAGKILIRGKYLLNRSSGVNRIMGGSVQVN